MHDRGILTFGPFRLDLDAEQLWRGDTVVPLTAKAFAVLRTLVQRAGQLVTRHAMLEAVWGTQYVSDAALASCIRDIRRALGDTAQTPQFVVTVRTRGFRFMAPVTDAFPPPPLRVSLHSPPATVRGPALLVGREAELTQLHRWYALACQGARQVVFATGEAGIGKTTLVDAFVTQVAATEEVWIGHGQCIEQHGAGEAYLPLLEALGQLGRRSDGTRLVELLRQQAPNWLLQMPVLLPAAEFDALQRRTSGITRERMLRELAEAVEVLTAERPLVLVLEDLHWSDSATLDWLAYVARRRQAARLLVLGTYRPVEALVHAHPVRKVMQELQMHGQCAELVLSYVSAAAVAAYLAQRFARAVLPEGLARVLHQRTHGNPLFLVTMVDDLVRQGGLQERESGWSLSGGIEAVVERLPETLRRLLEQQLEHLAPEEQALLEAASVAGGEFAVAAVAAAVDRTVDEVESRCAALARRGQFVRACGTDAWADGTVATRYGFLHDVYRDILYERVPIGLQVRWHRQIGMRLEAGYGAQAREIAAELAEHFVRGRDTERAVRYLQYAGENAQRRSAHQEAIGHFSTGLALLTALPDTLERARQELTLHLALGPALAVTRGYSAPEVEQAYVRAQALCQQLGESPQSLQVLQGLRSVYHDRLQFRQARDLGQQYLELAQRRHDQVALLEAHYALGGSLFFLGELLTARWHFEQGVRRYALQREHFRGLSGGEDP